ncbi:hypothetical protein VRRI112168_02840 [Vreelandella rituensis]|uniref:Uncharacterized protein n=1 Tax=Vreelandella rituensis TaxID=2282306 RepID=A0A368U9T4_9GAMM|nr:hypothetical protein [Halomonas rituensis]RCV93681.1 hypothetical protein DU506_00560 [Halomonas rituensis]
MSAQNLKVIGYALMGIGALLALFGLIATFNVYQGNSEIAAGAASASAMLGGFGSQAVNAMGMAKASYMPGIVALLLGAGSVVGGVVMLQKSNSTANTTAS